MRCTVRLTLSILKIAKRLDLGSPPWNALADLGRYFLQLHKALFLRSMVNIYAYISEIGINMYTGLSRVNIRATGR